MLSLLKKIVQDYLVAAIFKLVNGIRLLVLFIIAITVCVIINIFSILSGILYLIFQYKTNGYIAFDGFLIFFSAIFIISLLIFLKLMCKQNWIKILKRNCCN